MAFQKNVSENSYQLMNLNIPKSISGILTEVSMIHDFSQKSSKLDFYIRLLEEEMERINDAFKCELPHCMHLLEDAIEILNEEKLRLQRKGKGQVTEELMPLKSNLEKNKRVELSNDLNEKKKWMSNVQLGSTTIHYEDNTDTESHNSILSTKSRHEEEDMYSGIEIDLKKGGEAFVPFINPNIIKNEKIKVQVEELSPSIPVAKVETVDLMKEASRFIYQPYYLRKQRRSWSKDLHERFINAIAHLGGPQSSTPKKIRKLMNVDGLTNNEVKSHLQKHRLRLKNHQRRAQRNHSGSSRNHLPEGGSSAKL